MNKRYSHRVTEWSVLPTASLHGKILAMQKAGKQIIDLTVGVSDLPIPKTGKSAAIAAIKANNIPYTAIGGSIELKKALQEKLAKENTINATPENIIATTGAKQAIFQSLFVLTNPEDEIALFTPYWPAYTQMMRILQVNPVFLPFDDIASLSNKKGSTKLKGIIVNNPHNPTGKIFADKELEQIASFAKKHNLFVIADESYEKLVYEKDFTSFYTVDRSNLDNVVTIFSVSQSFSMMGWRMGYAVADKTIIEAMEAVQSSITAATSAVTQAAVAAILPTEKDYVQDMQNDFRKRRDAVFNQLSQISWMRCILPDSGPYFWCNIKRITPNTLLFSTKLLREEGVAVMPGEAFGQPGYIRIAFTVQPISVLKLAVEKMQKIGDTWQRGMGQ